MLKKVLTNYHNRLTNDHQLVFFRQLLLSARSPLVRSHASERLERAEKGYFGGEARLHPHFRSLHIGFAAHQLLGVLYAVFADELGKRAVQLVVDAGRDAVAVAAKTFRHVTQLQFVV